MARAEVDRLAGAPQQAEASLRAALLIYTDQHATPLADQAGRPGQPHRPPQRQAGLAAPATPKRVIRGPPPLASVSKHDDSAVSTPKRRLAGPLPCYQPYATGRGRREARVGPLSLCAYLGGASGRSWSCY